MQLGKTLVGAIIGAALGIGLYVAVHLLFRLDQVWLAIPVAILTGLGVRLMVSTWGHASYLRGAMTGILALAAYFGAQYVVAGLATQRANAQADERSQKGAAERRADTADEPADAPADEARAPEERPIPAQRPSGVALPKAGAPGQSPWDYLWLAIAALVAYELGRGTAAKPVVVLEETTTEVPQRAHPDA